MIEIQIDTDDLLKWSRYLNEIPKRTPVAIARALNRFGNNVKDGMIQYLAASTGLDPEQVNSVTHIDEASSGNLQWHMDASQALLTDANEWRRPWASRGSDNQFEQQILLNIETQPDACERCQEAADNGPYTAAEVSNMAAEWKDYVPPTPGSGLPVTNLLHPRCHCSTSQWKAAERRLPVMFNQEAHMWTPEQLGRELGKTVLDELTDEIISIIPKG